MKALFALMTLAMIACGGPEELPDNFPRHTCIPSGVSPDTSVVCYFTPLPTNAAIGPAVVIWNDKTYYLVDCIRLEGYPGTFTDAQAPYSRSLRCLYDLTRQ